MAPFSVEQQCRSPAVSTEQDFFDSYIKDLLILHILEIGGCNKYSSLHLARSEICVASGVCQHA